MSTTQPPRPLPTAGAGHADDEPRPSHTAPDERAAKGVTVVPAFDGYRAFAILGIVLLHILGSSGVVVKAGGSLEGQLIWGTLGQFVDVLFIVSGFVVFLPTATQHGHFGSVPSFAIRRGARLLPAFWLSLVILLVARAWQPDMPLPGAGELLSNFSGLQTIVAMIDPSIQVGFGINMPLWTLTAEITFYIVLPFVAASYFRRPLLGLLIAAAIAVLWRETFAHIREIGGVVLGYDMGIPRSAQLDLHSVNQLPNWAFSFAAGMTGAWAYVRLRERRDQRAVQRAATGVFVGAFASLALFAYLAGRYAIDTPPPFPAVMARLSSFVSLGYTASLATAMVALTLTAPRLQVPFAHPAVRKLGDISYGIYLIQAVVLWLVTLKLGLSTDGRLRTLAVWTAIVVPMTVLYGYLSARLLEQPIRRWAHRFGRQAQALSQAKDAPLASPRAPSHPLGG